MDIIRGNMDENLKKKEKRKKRYDSHEPQGKVHNSDFPRLSNFAHSHHKLANLNTNSSTDKEKHSESKNFNELKEHKTGKRTIIFSDGCGSGRDGTPEIMKLCFKTKESLLFNISKKETEVASRYL